MIAAPNEGMFVSYEMWLKTFFGFLIQNLEVEFLLERALQQIVDSFYHLRQILSKRLHALPVKLLRVNDSAHACEIQIS